MPTNDACHILDMRSICGSNLINLKRCSVNNSSSPNATNIIAFHRYYGPSSSELRWKDECGFENPYVKSSFRLDGYDFYTFFDEHASVVWEIASNNDLGKTQ